MPVSWQATRTRVSTRPPVLDSLGRHRDRQLLGAPESAFYAACALLLLVVAVLTVVLKPALALWVLAVLFSDESRTPSPWTRPWSRPGHPYLPGRRGRHGVLIATAVHLIRPPPPPGSCSRCGSGVILAVNLALGVAAFGLPHAVTGCREWLSLLTAAALVVVAGPWTSRFWRPWFVLPSARSAWPGWGWRDMACTRPHPDRHQWPAG